MFQELQAYFTNEKHIPLTYGMIFGMPGIPCVYYGSEWGAKAHKNEGDPALRVCFDEPLDNELFRIYIKTCYGTQKTVKHYAMVISVRLFYKTSTAYLKENMMMNVFLSLSMQTKILLQCILTLVAVRLLT